MMPPKCRLCDRGHETGDDCELICFARTASDQEWHDWAASPAAIPDHPPDCGWFCDAHVETARPLVHCDLTSALDHVRTHGHPAVAQWLTTLCHQIAEQSEPDLLKSNNS